MGSNEEHDTAKLETLLEAVMDSGLVVSGTIAQDASQQKLIWFLRENLAAACLHEGCTYKYDVSLPVSKMYALVEAVREKFSLYPECVVMGYGHLGDGNLHLNVTAPNYEDKYLALLEPFVYEFTCTLPEFLEFATVHSQPNTEEV